MARSFPTGLVPPQQCLTALDAYRAGFVSILGEKNDDAAPDLVRMTCQQAYALGQRDAIQRSRLTEPERYYRLVTQERPSHRSTRTEISAHDAEYPDGPMQFTSAGPSG